MPEIVVSARCDYPHPPAVMWQLFADPTRVSTLDPRITVAASRGVAGAVGSSYDLSVRMGPLEIPQTVTVRKSIPEVRLEAVTAVEGRDVATQLAEFVPTHVGTAVTWTVTQRASWLLAWAVRRKANKELARWLEAAATELSPSRPAQPER